MMTWIGVTAHTFLIERNQGTNTGVKTLQREGLSSRRNRVGFRTKTVGVCDPKRNTEEGEILRFWARQLA
jgi:hypothetical protein